MFTNALFAAMVIPPEWIVIAVLAVIAAVAVVKVAFRSDDRTEGRRKEAAKIGKYFNEIGATHSAEFFTNYSVGDYSGMWKEASSILSILGDPVTRAATSGKIRDTLLKLAFDNPKDKQSVIDLLAERGLIVTEADPAADPAAKTAKK